MWVRSLAANEAPERFAILKLKGESDESVMGMT